jgi:hypothetical protein
MIPGLAAPQTAAADCTTFGQTSLCSFGGDVDGRHSLSYAPYPCAYDYYCNDEYNWFMP